MGRLGIVTSTDQRHPYTICRPQSHLTLLKFLFLLHIVTILQRRGEEFKVEQPRRFHFPRICGQVKLNPDGGGPSQGPTPVASGTFLRVPESISPPVICCLARYAF
jgi:hypothetical protein